MSGITGSLLMEGGEEKGRGRSFHACNPSSGEKLQGTFFSADRGQTEAAVAAAVAAAWAFAQLPGSQRAALLRGIAASLTEVGDDLIERAGAETALPRARLLGELARTRGQLELFAALVEDGSWVDARLDRGDPTRQPPKPDLRTMLVPLGPVAVFGASNFPLAFSVAGGDSASALAAGCPVVVKAHPAHPGTSELAGRAIQRAIAACGMPAGSFSLLHGEGREVGEWLVRADGIGAVGFTGSFAAGRALHAIAGSRRKPIPFFAEMGSTNPVVVLPGAIADGGLDLASRLADSALLACGQFCTSPGVVFVPQSAAGTAFVGHMAEKWRTAKLLPMVQRGVASNFASAVEEVRRLQGVTVIAEGPRQEGFAGVAAVLFEAGVASLLMHERLREEIYGPAAVVVRYGGESDLRAGIEVLDGQLTATILGDDEELRSCSIAMLARRAGRLLFSGVPTGVEVGHAMQHGGPWPASSDSRFTSVGTGGIRRWARPLCFQDAPEAVLPLALRNGNPLGITRLVDGSACRE
ncbi:MAG: aldehyde dehydrogenase (NADP(+)) [Planctomycetota bacterium]